MSAVKGESRPLPRVVIAHDFAEAYGGAERIAAEMAIAFPDAPFYAILGRRSVAQRMGIADRFTTLLPARPRVLRHYRLATPLFPAYTDRVRLPEADVVISSCYAFAHRLRSLNDAPRVCYCYSPLRFAWSMEDHYRDIWAERGALKQRSFGALAAWMRRSDRAAAQGVERYLTEEQFTADQIERFYGKPCQAIGAPVDCDLFHPNGRGPDDHWLFCGRLIEPYKKILITLEAFRSLPHERLVVAGDGPAMEQARAIAPPNVEFRGALQDDELVEAMQRAKALIFPSRDDFGLVPVEVMACGRPVLAYADGGALHTVADGLTGTFFGAQTAEAVRAAIAAFDPAAYDSAAIRAHALRWDRKAWRERLVAEVRAVADAA
jgi:glycosyltransferase involved in cell wall biosynthesis